MARGRGVRAQAPCTSTEAAGPGEEVVAGTRHRPRREPADGRRRRGTAGEGGTVVEWLVEEGEPGLARASPLLRELRPASEGPVMSPTRRPASRAGHDADRCAHAITGVGAYRPERDRHQRGDLPSSSTPRTSGSASAPASSRGAGRHKDETVVDMAEAARARGARVGRPDRRRHRRRAGRHGHAHAPDPSSRTAGRAPARVPRPPRRSTSRPPAPASATASRSPTTWSAAAPRSTCW